MKYYIIAGEASGDLHGSNLMAGLKKADPNPEFRFWGGDLMAKHAGNPVKHYKEMAFMGFVKVVTNLGTIFKNIKHCKNDIIKYQPDVIILIDYAGFNLRIAEFAHKNNIRVYYYISPKIWAWKTNRIKKIKKYVNRMFTILPFETEFYNSHDFKVDYVGNPINDAINERPDQEQTSEQFLTKYNLPNKPTVALLAGSRTQEIKLMLPVMLEISRFFPNYQFIIAGAPGIDQDLYNSIISTFNAPIIYNNTYQILSHSKAALVTSGTATLETGLLNIPQIVCYHTNIGNFIYKIGRKLIKVKWISLVNLILDKEAVKELVQNTFKKEYLVKELDQILNNIEYRQQMLDNYAELMHRIGKPGASEKAAQLIFNALNE